MRTLIFDANGLLHRVCHLPALAQLNAGRIPTGGVYGTLTSLLRVLQIFSPTSVIFAWDGGYSRRRRLLLPDYKASRQVDPGDEEALAYRKLFQDQALRVEVLLPRLGIRTIRLPGREADDVIALLTSLLTGDRIVVSDDNDFLHLISSGVDVFRPRKGDYVSVSSFDEMMGFHISKYIYYHSTLGCKSDDVPGIPGVGPKTVRDMMQEDFTGWGEYFDKCEEKGGRAAKIAESQEIVLRNACLVDLALEEFNILEVRALLSTLSMSVGFNSYIVTQMLTKYGMQSLIDTMSAWGQYFSSLH